MDGARDTIAATVRYSNTVIKKEIIKKYGKAKLQALDLKERDKIDFEKDSVASRLLFNKADVHMMIIKSMTYDMEADKPWG